MLAVTLAAPHGMARAPDDNTTLSSQASAGRFPGMDQSVNVGLAEQAGAPARKPYINVEEWGDLWNLMLLLGGGVCGFVIGRRWDHVWGKPRQTSEIIASG